MGKNYKTILLILPVLFILLFTFFWKKSEKTSVGNISIEKNNMVIEDFDFSKNIDDSGGYYRILADVARFNRSMGESVLDNCSIDYKSGDTKAFFNAKNCKLVIDKSLTLEGDINGYINEVQITSEKNGIFEYNLKEELGHFYNGINVKADNTTIQSKKAFIDKNSEIIEFKNNVEVNRVYEN